MYRIQYTHRPTYGLAVSRLRIDAASGVQGVQLKITDLKVTIPSKEQRVSQDEALRYLAQHHGKLN